MADEGEKAGDAPAGTTANTPRLVPNYIGNRVLTRGDRLFSPLNDLLIILAAISHAGSLMIGGSTHRTANPLMRMKTNCLDYDFALRMRGPLEHALKGTLPNRIEISLQKRDGSVLNNPKLDTIGLVSVMTHITAPFFIIFFDRYIGWMNDNRRSDLPPVLSFARVVRNAAAHGKLRINDPHAVPVSWQRLTYGPADNGRHIIGNDMRLGDVLGLSFEVSDILDTLQAPIL